MSVSYEILILMLINSEIYFPIEKLENFEDIENHPATVKAFVVTPQNDKKNS